MDRPCQLSLSHSTYNDQCKMPPVIAQVDGYYASTCGYCKNDLNRTTPAKKEAFNLHLHRPSASLYARMIDRNWRRCGTFFYRPRNEDAQMCCPQYAIRIKVDDFTMAKAHQKIMRKFRAMLVYGDPLSASGDAHSTVKEEDPNLVPINASIRDAVDSNYSSLHADTSRLSCKKDNKQLANASMVIPFLCGHGLDIGNQSRHEVANEFLTHVKFPDCVKSTSVSENTGIIHIITHDKKETSKQSSVKANDSNDDTVNLVLVVSRAKFKNDEFELYKSYQIAVHGDKPEEITSDSYERFLCHSKLEEGVPQRDTVISIKVQISSDTSFEFDGVALQMIPILGYGTFHARYELRSNNNSRNSKLIALSVWDILPSGVSSVYFIYSTEYSKYSLGTFSTLLEVALVDFIRTTIEEFKYYHLGYYVHNCQKMRYKGQFSASELLCPVTMMWTALDDRVRHLLDTQLFVRLYEGSANDQALALVDGMDKEVMADSLKQVIGKLKFILTFLKPPRLLSGQDLLSQTDLQNNVEILENVQQFARLMGYFVLSDICIAL